MFKLYIGSSGIKDYDQLTESYENFVELLRVLRGLWIFRTSYKFYKYLQNILK